jgi:hypothetical protein
MSNISLNFVLSVLRIFQGHVSIDFRGNTDEESVAEFFNDSMSSEESQSQRSFSINYKTGKAFNGSDNRNFITEIENKKTTNKDKIDISFTSVIDNENFNNSSDHIKNDKKESLIDRKISKTVSNLNERKTSKKSSKI